MNALILLINMARVRPLQQSARLTVIAQERAEYLCTHPFSHQGWKSYDSNFSYRGENIAKGYNNNIKLVEQAFMNSPDHKANIVNTDYQYVGVAQSCDITVEEFGGINK